MCCCAERVVFLPKPKRSSTRLLTLWRQNVQDRSQYYPYEGSPSEKQLDIRLWLGSNHFLRSLLISTLPVTTAYFHDLFADLSSYVVFFTLLLHPLVLALKFLWHTNELLVCVALAFPHCSNETRNRLGIGTEHRPHLIPNCQTSTLLIVPLTFPTLKVLQLKVFGIKSG